MAFLTDMEQHVVGAGTFRVSLYKALLFIKIAEAIKAGALHITHSYTYRSLDEYLIPKAAWQANRTDYLTRAALTEVADWDRIVQRWTTGLDQQYHTTNRRILANDNPSIRFEKDGSWHLTTPQVEKPPHLPLWGIFPEKHGASSRPHRHPPGPLRRLVYRQPLNLTLNNWPSAPGVCSRNRAVGSPGL